MSTRREGFIVTANALLFEDFKSSYEKSVAMTFTLAEYFEFCRKDPMTYALAAERMVKAIGEPRLVQTKSEPRLLRLFGNRTLKFYDAFEDFYGMEGGIIEEIVSFYRHAAQGLEERKQVLYLLGPVGSAKSTLAIKLKSLMERYPIYVLVDGDTGERSPLLESPLGLFNPEKFGTRMESEYGISPRYLTGLSSPWAQKRMQTYHGDLARFRVQRIYPSVLNQLAVAKTEPGDENTQDISSLVGKVDMRKLSKLSQDDPDAYSYSGGLCLTTQGLLEFVEMFKAPIKVLHPMLTATQEGQLQGNGGIRRHALPGHRARPLERERVEKVQQQSRQRSVPRSNLHRQGALLPASHGGSRHLSETAARLDAGEGALRARHASHAREIHGAVAVEDTGQLEHLFEIAGL